MFTDTHLRVYKKLLLNNINANQSILLEQTLADSQIDKATNYIVTTWRYVSDWFGTDALKTTLELCSTTPQSSIFLLVKFRDTAFWLYVTESGSIDQEQSDNRHNNVDIVVYLFHFWGNLKLLPRTRAGALG